MNDFFKYLFFSFLIISFYFLNPYNVFVNGNEMTFVFVVISCLTIEFFIQKAKAGEKIYLRPISGMSAMEEAVGRATEMGTSVLTCT